MSNKVNIYSNKSKTFGILIAILAVSLVLTMSIGITHAWFTDSHTLTKNNSTPEITVSFVKATDSNTVLATEFTNAYLSTNSISKIYARVDTNIDYVYLRAQIVAYYYDSSDNIIGGLDASGCFTKASGWYSLDAGNVYEKGYIYWGTSSAPSQISVAHSSLTAVATELISSFSIPNPLPTDAVGVKFQIFAEAVQGNNTGLAKWVI